MNREKLKMKRCIVDEGDEVDGRCRYYGAYFLPCQENRIRSGWDDGQNDGTVTIYHLVSHAQLKGPI